MKTTLLNDVHRCDGVGDDEDGWREGCEHCLRRTAPRTGPVLMMPPPAIIVFECEAIIEPDAGTVSAGTQG